MKEEAILVLGSHRQTLAVMASIHGRGSQVYLGHDAGRRTFCEASRFVDDVCQFPKDCFDDPSAFLLALQSFLRGREEVRFLFPVGTREINLVLELRDALPASVRVVAPDPRIWAHCLDKNQMAATIEQLNLPRVVTVEAAELSALRAAIDTVGYPCIIKPSTEASTICGEKALILKSSEDFEAVPTWNLSDRSRLLVQPFFEGIRHNIYFFAESGRISEIFETKVEKTNRLNGTGFGVMGLGVESSPVWCEYTSRLVRHLNYEGVGCLQYLIDPKTGESCFLELNARLGANYGHIQKSGIDLARRWVDQVAGLVSIENQVQPRSRKLRYAWTYGDCLGLERSVSEGEMPPAQAFRYMVGIIARAVRADVHLDWSWNDPLPAIYLYSEYIARIFRRPLPFRRRARRRSVSMDSGPQ